MFPIDETFLRAVAPQESGIRARNQNTILSAIGPIIEGTLDTYKINTSLRVAHFIAQTCFESEGFCVTLEEASGEAYEGRKDLGNTRPGDGVRYKGRGLIQLTGRANYASTGARLNLPLVDNPDIAADPVNALLIACDFWQTRSINQVADQDNLTLVTRKVNGGLNGLLGRRTFLVRSKAAIARLTGLAVPTGMPQPMLHLGMSGPAVVRLQQALQAKGIPTSADGSFGPGTEAAVKQFQKSIGLVADGVVGQGTWARLI